MTANRFGIIDYCLFGATLLVSGGVGIYSTCRGAKQNSPSEVLMGGRNMPVVPTALSLLTSFISGISLLAIPAEVYQRGVGFWLSRVAGTSVALICAAVLALPIFYKFNPTSLYQYLEERYQSPALRKIGAALFIIFNLFFMAVVLYAPSIALTGVTVVPMWAYIISVGTVCLAYTAYGGLKAVVWTDTIQAVIMVIGTCALFFKGAVDAGGIKESFQVASDRWEVLANWDPNPFQYMSMWSALFGGIGMWLSVLTFNQISVQRYLSLRSLKDAEKVIAINIPSYIIMVSVVDLLGVVMYAYYRDCDPISAKLVDHKDQLVIYFALDIFRGLPGMPGLFLACLFSGTLSSFSSGINALAAVTWEDYFKLRYEWVSMKRQATYIKCIALVYGVISIGLAFACKPLGGIIKTILTCGGATNGPLVGLFLLGILIPWAGKRCAIVGLVVSFVVTLWISIGNVIFMPYKDYALSVSVSGCLNGSNETDFRNFTNDPYGSYTGLSTIYTISDLLFPLMGMIIVLIVAIPISFCLKDSGAKYRRELTVFVLKRSRNQKDESTNGEELMMLKRPQ